MTKPNASEAGAVRSGRPGKQKAAAGGVGVVVLAVIILAIQHFTGIDLTGKQQPAQHAPKAAPTASKDDTPKQATSASPDDDIAAKGVRAMEQAFRNHQSDLIVEGVACVIKVLPDDREGDRHQRFILKTSSGQTVLVAHNIDLAPRVPVHEGDEVRFRGEYEWTEQGGTIHWTHHDPGGWREGGWIEHKGRRYE